MSEIHYVKNATNTNILLYRLLLKFRNQNHQFDDNCYFLLYLFLMIPESLNNKKTGASKFILNCTLGQGLIIYSL